MEIKTLRSFLELARRGNFTAAARALNLSQPALSKQILELEAELGATLLLRGRRKTSLTEAGEYLYKNASEIVELAERTRKNIARAQAEIGGDLYVAAAESRNMTLVVKAMRKTRERYGKIKFHIFSGNAEAVAERLERGLADFGTFIQPAPVDKFDYVNLPLSDRWGLLLRKDDALSRRKYIEAADLAGLPLICSAQHSANNEIMGWMGGQAAKLELVGTYNLLYNGAIMVEQGLGAALCLDGIADTSPASSLCFRPFKPPLEVNMAIAWKKGRQLSAASAIFQDFLQQEIVSFKACRREELQELFPTADNTAYFT